ncbi:MAG TPA: MgtC/SapB family protein [Verrucomicrobiae bacterium]|nr:MgtC/SapB family protein [Verrucomicrobiae bacterium]
MSHIGFPEMLLRVVLAFGAGFAIGWERECHGRPAGLRTNILACVAAAVAMIVSEILFVQSVSVNPAGTVRSDPARLGAGVLTGIGFLGAGAILRHENIIRGVTTAASLWFVTVLGLAFGSGMYDLALLGVGLAMVTLFILPRVERYAQADWYATLTISATLEGPADQALRTKIESLGPLVQTLKLNYDLEKKQKTITCDLKLKRSDRFEAPDRLVNDLSQLPGVLRVAWT